MLVWMVTVGQTDSFERSSPPLAEVES